MNQYEVTSLVEDNVTGKQTVQTEVIMSKFRHRIQVERCRHCGKTQQPLHFEIVQPDHLRSFFHCHGGCGAVWISHDEDDRHAFCP
jgi:uncharacterized protein with PIN domain